MRSTRRWRALRVSTALALITFLFTGSAVQAGPVTINQVVQTLTRTQGPADLTINTLTQDPVGGAKTPTSGQKADGPSVPTGSGDAPQLDKLTSNMSIAQDPQNVGVEIVEEAEVEGTICDCGEILLPGAAFPKWPLLFLAAVPLVFIHDCQDCNETTTPTPTPTPTPTQTPTPTPEPASLLLLGTGLLAVGAGVRRRYAKSKE